MPDVGCILLKWGNLNLINSQIFVVDVRKQSVIGSRMKLKYIILFSFFPVLLTLDQWTKLLVISKFRLGETLPILEGYFNLTYVRNTGAAFGIFSQADPTFRIPFFILIPLIALVAIIYVFRKIRSDDLRLSVALSLVISGAIGNLIDRIRWGYVVDFLDFHWQYQYHFPAFNVADSSICIGVGLLSLDLLKQTSDESNASKDTQKNVPSSS